MMGKSLAWLWRAAMCVSLQLLVESTRLTSPREERREVLCVDLLCWQPRALPPVTRHSPACVC